MSGPLSGPGIGLNLPQNLYPSALQNAPLDAPSNRITLAAGDAIPIPAGTWYITTNYCILQYLDPVTGVWVMGASAAWAGGMIYVKSDGFNYRMANMTGCPISATISNQGSNYVQATTTITVAGGTSTWQPIVGGALGFSTVVTANAGAGYGVAPLVFIPPPPPAANNPNGVGGIQASGWVSISGGTVNGFTFTNPGAGYPTAPTPVVLPNPTDPNLSVGITAATLAFTLVTGGGITGVLNTNPGAPLATLANITLTVAGAGTNATVTPNVMQTVTAVSVTGGGVGYGATVNNLVTTVGGYPSTGTIANDPNGLYLAFRPRPAQVSVVSGNSTIAAQAGLVYDGGLFLGTPTAIVSPQGIVSTVATIALTMGSRPDFVIMQPAP